MKKEVLKTLKVLKKPPYILFTLIMAAGSFAVYALLLNRSILLTYTKSGNFSLVAALIPDLITGFMRSSTSSSLLLTLTTSALIGINLALAAFRLRDSSQLNKTDISSLPGVLVSLIAPACPACATTFLAFAGATSIYALLPFNGISFQILALGLLVLSGYYTASQIDNEICRV